MSDRLILVAVDSNYETEFEGIKICMSAARKVYKLNETTLISVVGNPFKIWDIYKYILKLKDLGHTKSYESILSDIQDVFDTSNLELNKILSESKEILYRISNGRNAVPSEEILSHFTDKPEHLAMMKDLLQGTLYNQPSVSLVHLFGLDSEMEKVRVSFSLLIGSNFTQEELKNTEPGMLFGRLASADIENKSTPTIEAEMREKLSKLWEAGWEQDPAKTLRMIEGAKEILAESLVKISQYESSPNIIFYELSERTGFKFEEPDLPLKEVVYTRGQ